MQKLEENGSEFQLFLSFISAQCNVIHNVINICESRKETAAGVMRKNQLNEIKSAI